MTIHTIPPLQPVTAQRPALVEVTASPQSDLFPTGSPFYFPELGDVVLFRRSIDSAHERGIVRGRSFGTKHIDIVDFNGKPLQLHPTQYAQVTQ